MGKLYQHIASRLAAIENCRKHGNSEWIDRHTEWIEDILKEKLPSGSGFDSGTLLNWERSTPNKLIFLTSFHHMDEHGGYDGWTEHEVIVTPDLASGFNLRVTGRDRNGIKDYIGDIFADTLSAECVG